MADDAVSRAQAPLDSLAQRAAWRTEGYARSPWRTRLARCAWGPLVGCTVLVLRLPVTAARSGAQGLQKTTCILSCAPQRIRTSDLRLRRLVVTQRLRRGGDGSRAVTSRTGGHRPCLDCDSTRDHRPSPSRSAGFGMMRGEELGDVHFGHAERDVLQLEVVFGWVAEEPFHAVHRGVPALPGRARRCHSQRQGRRSQPFVCSEYGRAVKEESASGTCHDRRLAIEKGWSTTSNVPDRNEAGCSHPR